MQYTILTLRKEGKTDNWSLYNSICTEKISDI